MPEARLLDPGATAAVVLGAHDWTEAGLGRAPSFLRSAKGVLGYLIDSAGLALDPALVLDFFDSGAGAGEQLAEIKDALDARLRERRDEGRPVADLLVYYVGHGHTDDQGHLALLVRRSRKGMEAETGIKAPDLARVLKLAAPQQRRVVVLDCCFSEAAARGFIGMSPSLDQAVAATAAKDLADDHPQRGTLLLCSSPLNQVSMGAPNAEQTLFTGAVLDVLRLGAEGRPAALSLADVRDAAHHLMVVNFGANAPRPVLHQPNAAHGDLTRTPAFPNRKPASPATQRTLQGPSPAPGAPWRWPEVAPTEGSQPPVPPYTISTRDLWPSPSTDWWLRSPTERQGNEAEGARPDQPTTQDRRLPFRDRHQQSGYARIEAARVDLKVATHEVPQSSTSPQQPSVKPPSLAFIELKEAGTILGIIFAVLFSVAIFAGLLALAIKSYQSSPF